MSDIVKAREILQALLKSPSIDAATKRQLRRALKLMYREPALRRRTRRRAVVITPHLRGRIQQLLKTDLTQHEIATSVGVNNSGRISEVAHGQR